ncbi:nucleolar protein 8 [Nematolebias whitei]|uniref:nucleolar protein 8 n=1 Tax=Nematolebias whitei TaxID=451745 RepID=UPI0018971335|nr:nucleolar protein 8 [Nematolebias whitei]
MRRLYVGGLSHTVTQKDLKDRFGKFGEVKDVELRTRMGEDDVPYKTFGYININISDADLKKCLTVLNKSKWKGGTLQIEAAKESFLHRLAQERQEAAEQRLHPSAAENKEQKLLDSLSKAGVENFTMKAAVPGTEVPGHKDWVVSKFGRVLPVLQLSCQKGTKARTSKYDPSKYCHNIRRLDRNTSDEFTPVTQLTWEVQGGDDDISKKRRGEFPPFELPRPKKNRTDAVKLCDVLNRKRFEQPVSSADHAEVHRLANESEPPASHRPAPWKRRRFSDSDSDEEIRRLVADQQTSHNALQQEVEDDNVEVVGTDYLVKSEHKGDEDEDDYDSADTDELFASRRNPREELSARAVGLISENSTDEKTEMKRRNKSAEEEEGGNILLTSCRPSSPQQEVKRSAVLPVPKPSESDGDEEEAEASSSSLDSDYEAMFSNTTRLEISMADLQKLAETASPTILGSGSERDIALSPAERAPPKKGTTPEEILASILGEDSSEDQEQQKKKKRRKRRGVTSTPLPAFMGTKSLMETSGGDEEEEGGGRDVKQQELNSESKQSSEEEEEVKNTASPKAAKTDLPEEEEEEPHQTVFNTKSAAEDQPSSNSCSEEEEVQISPAAHSEEEEEVQISPAHTAAHSESSTSEEEEEEERAPPRLVLGAEEEEELQRKANMRRLAALQQRQKEVEEHRKLIQGALSNMDTPAPSAGKHIVFGSDEEEEEVSKTSLFQDSQSEEEGGGATANQQARLKPSGPRLFADDEADEGGDEEEEGSRFDIRPEFEGRAGQKLMELQSRFGTDKRFRMDSRFLEDEEEQEEEEEEQTGVCVSGVRKMKDDEDLEEERKKNLSILQSVLGSSRQTSSKTESKAKRFRDVSALHYDPSREEHAAFETKAEEPKKESKSARRKKREEAQKLPEVSKEIYFDVSTDLKTVFGPMKDDSAEGEKPKWDQLEEEEEEGGGEEEQLLSADRSNEESSGFKFSFFGDDAETGSGQTTEYKAETIQAQKVSWHQDPRFLDSSSEEEEEEQEEEEESSVAVKATEKETPSHPDFFFFSPGDIRLTEGPGLFCRTCELEEQREQWEESRSALREDYRKKHRDARKKLRASQKS